MSRVIKSPLDGTEVINFVGTTTDQNSGSTTVQDIADLASGGLSQVQSNETQAVPYTGVEVPSVAGVNIGDTKTVQFTDGTVVNYTWDGTTWVVDFVEEVAPKPTLTTVTGGTGLPNTVTFDNGVDAPTVFNYIEGARHDLRLTSPIVERGSDDPINPKGAQFLHNSYSHLNGFSDNWVSNNIDYWGNNRPTLSLWANGDLYSGYNGTSPDAYAYPFMYFRASDAAFNISLNYYSFGTSALGIGSKNFGNYGKSTGENSINFGVIGLSSGTNSINFASNGVASGFLSTNFGSNGVASGNFSINCGRNGLASNNDAINFSLNGKATGFQSTNFAVNSTANTSNEFSIGVNTINWIPAANTTENNLIEENILFTVGNGATPLDYLNYPQLPYRSQSITHFANGKTQINNTGYNNLGVDMTQDAATPASVLEVVSTTSGVLVPRLTSSEITTWQSSFNITTDVTGLGGIGNEKHSRQGEMVYNLTTSLNTQARWNGTSWVFVTW